MNLDLYFFNLINQFAGKWEVLDFLGIFFAKYFEYVLLLCLVLFLIKDFKKYWLMVVEALTTAILVRFVITEIIRWFWFRPRPFVNDYVNLLISKNFEEASFPSGHASFYFALSTIIYIYNKKIGILFYVGSSLIVIARVFVGVHFPLDILAGALIGLMMGLILNKVFRNIETPTLKD